MFHPYREEVVSRVTLVDNLPPSRLPIHIPNLTRGGGHFADPYFTFRSDKRRQRSKRSSQKTISENNRISYHNSPNTSQESNNNRTPRRSLRTGKKDSDKTGQNKPKSSLQGGVGTIHTVIFRLQTSFQTLPLIPYFPRISDYRTTAPRLKTPEQPYGTSVRLFS